MKKIFLTFSLICAMCVSCFAGLTDDLLNQSVERLSQLSSLQSSLSSQTTSVSEISDLKSSTVSLCSDVITTGKQLVDVCKRHKNGENVSSELVTLSAQVVKEGQEVAALIKQIAPAAKALKSIKSLKDAMSAKSILSDVTEATTLMQEEVSSETQLISELMSSLKK